MQAELAAGADVMARDDLFDTPLHRAAGQPSAAGTPANIQALVDAGADARARNKDGKTPTDLAREQGMQYTKV